MEIFHDRLNAHWYESHTDVLDYINAQNNKYFTSEHLLNALTEQAIHIITNSESKYWYLAANYNLLNCGVWEHIISNSTLDRSFITFEALPGIMGESPDFYIYNNGKAYVEAVMDILLTNYITMVSLLKKGVSNGNYIR